MIRKATKSDIDKINELGMNLHNNFKETYHMETEVTNPLAILYVYEESNEIKAYVYLINLEDNMDLLSIYVDNKVRHTGIGTSLIKYMQNNYPNKTITLEVSTKNQTALNLYQKMGFEKVGLRKNYYDNADGLVMKWGIK